MNFLVGKTLLEAVDEIDLSSDRPFRAVRRIFDGFNNERSRTVKIAFFDDLADAFGMNQDLHVGNVFTNFIDMPWLKTAVHRTMPAPENELSVMKLFFGIPAKLFVRIPQDHLIQRNAELRSRISSQMLVREEKHLVKFFEVNIEERNGIRRCADYTLIAAAKCLDRGR